MTTFFKVSDVVTDEVGRPTVFVDWGYGPNEEFTVVDGVVMAFEPAEPDIGMSSRWTEVEVSEFDSEDIFNSFVEAVKSRFVGIV
jgi:hypothetical protein